MDNDAEVPVEDYRAPAALRGIMLVCFLLGAALHCWARDLAGALNLSLRGHEMGQTRRQAIGSLIGGAAAAPEAFKQVATDMAKNAVRTGVPLPYRSVGESSDAGGDYLANLKRQAAGDIRPEDNWNWSIGPTFQGDSEHVAALRSVSPMAKAVILHDRRYQAARAACMREALEELIRRGLA
jgi:hypothetical protein